MFIPRLVQWFRVNRPYRLVGLLNGTHICVGKAWSEERGLYKMFCDEFGLGAANIYTIIRSMVTDLRSCKEIDSSHLHS